MRKITVSKQIEINGKLLPINTQGEGMGCYVEMLTASEREMTAMLSHHNKVLMFRVDIRIYNYTGDNEVISNFLRRFKRWAMAYYKTNRIGHIWCREVEEAKKQHYHLFIMVDGNKAQTTQVLFDKCNEIAVNYGLSAWLPKNPYYRVKRGDTQKYNEAFERVSYLAKQRGKSIKGKRANSFSASRIKLKPTHTHNGRKFTSADNYINQLQVRAKTDKSKQLTPKPKTVPKHKADTEF